ncbi:FecR family protein [Brenneria corticis]|uniref:Sugar ABC transporter substrate-binding protein n=1 Tax=Brenneria corticis TaxID=2173106 RepID=A0A2U1U9A8_9GAMM|nr:FecR family protein [Brenneria sp. CFCC 11842]PWC18255.1 sugar ABC transporter substrate-binding protein [Brenneria sp. CFCC 11842]
MARQHINDPIAQQAIEWMVLLRSGEATQTDYDDYQRWRRENARHEHACQRIEQTLGQFQPLLQALPHEPIRQALLAPSGRRKVLQYGLGMFSIVTLSSLLLNQHYPLSPLLSDAKTATAQRKVIPLNDGSTLTLNARTAVDINVRPEAAVRRIALHSGGMLANIAQDPQRPFMISTTMGDIVALQANVNVRYEDGGVHVGVLDNIAKITNRLGQSVRINAGHGVWFDNTTLYNTAITPEAETAWLHGRLEVRDRSLASVVRSLRDYTPGVIRLDPAVADLRVSGNFPLDDVNYTLDSLAQTMPIAIVHTTDYWIHIRAASL